MKGLMSIGAAVFTAILAGCATGRDVPRISEMLRNTTGQDGRACVRVDDIQGYGVLENDVISIDSFGEEYYLATVLPGCLDLATSPAIEFRGDLGEICGQSGDTIVTGLLTGENTCIIGQMFEFESQDEAFATYNNVLHERETAQDPASG